MAAYSIPLGTEDRLKLLYSYPNANNGEGLADTILHWFDQTLQRDGLAALGAKATVQVHGAKYFLQLDGRPEVAARFPEYEQRLPQFLSSGWDALTNVIPKIKKDGKWDPQGVGWRFFLPFGMPMLNQRSLQFFHYPPIRLLETMQDYLDDPVPVRWGELLAANGVDKVADQLLHETVVDGAPIAAPDNQGTQTAPDGTTVHLIPIDYFNDYQRAQVSLLLNASTHEAVTIPIVVYGGPATATFKSLYNVKIGVNVTATTEIIPGRKTAVLGANHPYRFYATAQIGNGEDVGSGHILPANCAKLGGIMVQDLIVARWQKVMADDPSQDPQAVLAACTTYWNDPQRTAEICALIQHQGSLWYPDLASLKYIFKLTPQQAVDLCQAHGNDPCQG